MKYREKGEYPNGLPYDDQPRRLMDDWATLDRRFEHIYAHLKADEYWQPETQQDIDFEPPVPTELGEASNGKPPASLKAFLTGRRK